MMITVSDGLDNYISQCVTLPMSQLSNDLANDSVAVADLCISLFSPYSFPCCIPSPVNWSAIPASQKIILVSL